ncbi:protein kinase domain-containing protein [Pseudonocardia sp. TRM90224]|uniref:protein kinase domain-containing protein n=1 Tax=Pseudonocardia sp. TRM90224 TaxID=2812678 RepID=UPI001E390233|nr:ATP-binding cassette domain-containing protein [Pseudonocardia sp. TRM90224]
MDQRMFGPYRIGHLLGRGGMGEVYRAFDTAQNRMVALKLLLPSLASDGHYTARFRRESELAARLREPHVIPIHRYGEIGGQLFIDMRLVEGRDLAEVLSSGPLEPAAAVDVVAQVAAALDAAHADGLVHRDVKPSNVLCAGSTAEQAAGTDFVYLVDFGIARSIGGAGITTDGAAIGSIDYMAPERFSQGPTDHRIDVYSLACLLFECLTARKPFVSPERLGVISAHMTAPPPAPSQVRPGTPAALDEVVARGMAKDPNDRHESAAALASAARAALAAPPAPPAPPISAPDPDPPAERVRAGREWWKAAAAKQAPPEPARPAPPPTVPPTGGWWTQTNAASKKPAARTPAAQASAPAAWWKATKNGRSAAPEKQQPAVVAEPVKTPEPRKPPVSPQPSQPPQQPQPPQPRQPAEPRKPSGPSPTLHYTARHEPATAPAAPPPPPARPAPAPAQVPPRAPGGPAAWQQRKATALHQLTAASVVIGRAAECDVVLADPLVSRRHSELLYVHGSYRIADLRSWNGTFVNGRRISEPTTIGPDDVVGIGHSLLHLQGGTLVEYTDEGDISFEADNLVVTRSGKRLLDGVGFALSERSLLAVVGPSGAGKSTLLGALTGQRPADSGQVRYAGRDLYDGYDELRQRIGLVPQDDILHPQLTVRRALRYAASLRFPADTPARERNERVEEVITELGLSEQATQRISTLSGGQRKRTSVALELLTRPSLLFLDEPTSGLDPGLDKSVMQTLRGLADDGRTVVVVTHSPAQLEVCDRLLVLAAGGKLAYFGPPGEALAYFGQKDFADMFLLLDQSRDVDWTSRFRASQAYAKYGAPATTAPPAAPRSAPPPAPRQQPALRQFGVLARRYLNVIASDRPFALFMIGLPLALAGFAQLLPGRAGLSAAEWGRLGFQPNDDPVQLLLILVLGCAFMGFAAAFRELVKERTIFGRERAIGLSSGAYVVSKLAVLGVLVTAQSTLFGVLAVMGNPVPDQPVALGDGTAEVIVAMVAVGLAIMVQGLLVSALIANADRGMPLLVLVLLLQFILCGALIPLSGNPPLEQLSWLVPARWGFAMVAATTRFRDEQFATFDPLWRPESAVWTLDLVALAVLTVVGAVLVLVVVRRQTALRKQPRRR